MELIIVIVATLVAIAIGHGLVWMFRNDSAFTRIKRGYTASMFKGTGLRLQTTGCCGDTPCNAEWTTFSGAEGGLDCVTTLKWLKRIQDEHDSGVPPQLNRALIDFHNACLRAHEKAEAEKQQRKRF